jgi:uncharacterized protein (TIGR00156 family)
MKCDIPTFGFALALAAAPAFASNQPVAGGFTGPDAVQLVSVADAAKLADDSPVKLQGYIVKSLGDEKYEFRDNSGTITVEIDGDDWRGVHANPETKVELQGEVDKEWTKAEIDVNSVRVVQ